MANYVFQLLRNVLMGVKKGGEKFDACSISEIWQFLQKHNVEIDATDIDFDTVVNVFRSSLVHAIQYQTIATRAIITMAVDMYDSKPTGVIFVGSQNNPIEHKCSFYCSNRVRMKPGWVNPRYDKFMLEVCRLVAQHNIAALDQMSPNAIRLEFSFINTAFGGSRLQQTKITRVFVKATDLDERVGVAIGREIVGAMDVVVSIAPSVTFVIITREMDPRYNDEIRSIFDMDAAMMTFTGYADGEIMRHMADDERGEIIAAEMSLSHNEEWVDILTGCYNRIMRHKYDVYKTRPYLVGFEEPTEVLPLFEKITATTYTKKRLSTV